MREKTAGWLTPTALESIHRTSMKLLAEVGVDFYDEEPLSIFKKHGLVVNGRNVRFSEEQVMNALDGLPQQFTIRARDPRKSVTVGDGDPVFIPAYGAPFILDENGRREPTFQDYQNLVRLADDLPNQDMSGFLLVQPADMPLCQAYPEMLYCGMTCSDKALMGSGLNKEGALQTLEMASLLFGESPEAMAEQPVALGLVDSLSPLQYSADSSGALIAYARWRQPLIIASMVMAGATGPVTLAGALAQQNAEILAGVILAQIVNPGTPVIYGAASTIMDLRSGSLSAGCPEMPLMARASLQLARYYGLPFRGGGGLTDAHTLDAQAGYESLLGLLTAVEGGVDLILHASGILSSFLAVSYEKFVMDDELCGLVRHFRRGLEVTPDTLAYDVIARVGPGNNFLEDTHTFAHCRSAFWQPAVGNREGIETWLASGQKAITGRARTRWQTLLAEHEDPWLDKITKRQLRRYVDAHSC